MQREQIAAKLAEVQAALKEAAPKLEWPKDDISIADAIGLMREHGLRDLQIEIEVGRSDESPSVNYRIWTGTEFIRGLTRREVLHTALAHLAPKADMQQLAADLEAAGDGSAVAGPGIDSAAPAIDAA